LPITTEFPKENAVNGGKYLKKKKIKQNEFFFFSKLRFVFRENWQNAES